MVPSEETVDCVNSFFFLPNSNILLGTNKKNWRLLALRQNIYFENGVNKHFLIESLNTSGHVTKFRLLTSYQWQWYCTESGVGPSAPTHVSKTWKMSFRWTGPADTRSSSADITLILNLSMKKGRRCCSKTPPSLR